MSSWRRISKTGRCRSFSDLPWSAAGVLLSDAFHRRRHLSTSHASFSLPPCASLHHNNYYHDCLFEQHFAPFSPEQLMVFRFPLECCLSWKIIISLVFLTLFWWVLSFYYFGLWSDHSPCETKFVDAVLKYRWLVTLKEEEEQQHFFFDRMNPCWND